LFNPNRGFQCETSVVDSESRKTSKELENDDQLETMQLRTLHRSRLQLRLPERQGEKPNGRMRLRRHLQVRLGVFLQEVLKADGTPRIGPRARRFPRIHRVTHA
jgi:hypothetical protein